MYVRGNWSAPELVGQSGMQSVHSSRKLSADRRRPGFVLTGQGLPPLTERLGARPRHPLGTSLPQPATPLPLHLPRGHHATPEAAVGERMRKRKCFPEASLTPALILQHRRNGLLFGCGATEREPEAGEIWLGRSYLSCSENPFLSRAAETRRVAR